MGGAGRSFPDTTWGLVSRLNDPASPDYRAAVERLSQRYWKPIYLYVRVAWAKSSEDAKDLTQAFLVWLLEGESLARYDVDRGSFRVFLKVLLRRFVGHEERALTRLKRGGGVQIFPLEDVEALDAAVANRREAPEELFDREWLATLMNHALDRLRPHFAASGREAQIRMFESHDLVPDERRPSYAELAERFGISVTDVRNQLFAVREALRAEVRAELMDLTVDDRGFQEEWNALLGP